MCFYLCSLNSLFLFWGCVFPFLLYLHLHMPCVLSAKMQKNTLNLIQVFLLVFPLTSPFLILNYNHLLCFPKALTCSSFLSQFVSSYRLSFSLSLNLTIMYIVWSSVPCTWWGGGCVWNKYLMSKYISLYSFPLLMLICILCCIRC